MNIKTIDQAILKAKHERDLALGRRDARLNEIETKRQHLQELEITNKALTELQAISERIQLNVYQSIQNLATYCLQTVFGEEYACQIDTAVRRGKVELDIYVMKGRLRLDPLAACGGGVADVLALALRIGVILSDNINKPRQILIADEPCRFVSEVYRSAVAELLESLAETYGFQLIMVTHDEAFKIGKVVEID